MTLAQAIAQWKLDNPIGSINPAVTPAEYEVMAADRGQMLLDTYNQQQAEAARIALRKKYRTWQTHKATWATEYARPVGTTLATALPRLQATRDAFNILVGDVDAIVEVLKDSGLVLDDSA